MKRTVIIQLSIDKRYEKSEAKCREVNAAAQQEIQAVLPPGWVITESENFEENYEE